MILSIRHVLAIGIAAASAPVATAAITYLSSTRFIQTTGAVGFPGQRIDAVGFTDFNVQATTLSPGFPQGSNLSSAAQTSRLLPDRLEAACWSRTGFIDGASPMTNAVEAGSFFSVRFSIDVPTPYQIFLGPVYNETINGGAAIRLRNPVTSVTLYSSPNFGSLTGVLAPGEYIFQVQSNAASRLGTSGVAVAMGSLVLPSPTAASMCVVGTIGCIARRSRREQLPNH